MGVISQKMGSAPIGMAYGSPTATVSATTLALDSAFVNGVSGDAFGVMFTSPVSQTSAALVIYAFMTAETGAPTDVYAAIFAGPSGAMDPQRPDTGAAIASSAVVSCNGQAANSWTTFTISSITLVAGTTYWLAIHNATATPASNYPTFLVRGLNTFYARFHARTTTDGFATDPTLQVNEAPVVFKFSDGSIMGNPYTTATAHANNTNDRGIRVTLDSAMEVIGVFNSTTSANVSSIKVYQGASEVASTPTFDLSQDNNVKAIFFSAAVTFAAGTAYDIVWKFGANTASFTRVDAGTSPPADVLLAMPSGLKAVTGATPGSYTVEDGFRGLYLLVNNVPLAASGGGSYTFIG